MKLLAPFGLAVSLLVPSSAAATTVTIGPPVTSLPPGPDFVCPAVFECISQTLAQRTLPDPSITLVAPADGKVTSWRVDGEGKLNLRVLRPAGDALIAEGTSAVATDLKGGLNETSLPIRANDVIGVDLDGASSSNVRIEEQAGATYSFFSPAVPDDGMPYTPVAGGDEELLLNARIVLAPNVLGVAPASGGTTGRDTVKIFGTYLDGATEVMFGSTLASSFTVDSANQITATTPALPASTVNVRVVGPGGTSAISTADQYTFVAPAALAPPLGRLPPIVVVSPVLSGVRQSASRWRRGSLLPRISRRNATPVGTTFSFILSKAATVRLTFGQRVAGSKVHGKCVAPTSGNTHKAKCQRTITAGALSFAGHAGANQIRFEGGLTSRKSLRPGSYTASIAARDSFGLQSVARSLSFTIVRS